MKLNLKEIEKISAVCKALANKNRLDIVKAISKTELDIKKIVKHTDMSSATVSAHVKILEKASVVSCRYMPAQHGVKKLCKLVNEEILIQLS